MPENSLEVVVQRKSVETYLVGPVGVGEWRLSARYEKEKPVLWGQQGNQRIHQTAGIATDACALQCGWCVINGNFHKRERIRLINLLDSLVGPDAIDAEVPEENYANGKGFGQIVTDAMAEEIAKEVGVGSDQNNSVDQKSCYIHRRELSELTADRSLARFRERPQPVPGEIADYSCRKGYDVGDNELNLLDIKPYMPTSA